MIEAVVFLNCYAEMCIAIIEGELFEKATVIFSVSWLNGVLTNSNEKYIFFFSLFLNLELWPFVTTSKSFNT